MDGDRTFSRNPAGGISRNSAEPSCLNQARADAMLLSGGGDEQVPGVPFRRKSSPPRPSRSEPPPVPPVRADVYPPELQNLLNAETADNYDAAWDVFVARHHRLLLHVARRIMPSDSAMDAYAHVLERLRRDASRALRAYSPDGRSQFTTWLVVVARRMCVDFYRQKFGRPRGESPSKAALLERDARYRLANFAGVEDALTQVAAEDPGPEGAIRNGQLQAALDAAVGSLSPEDQLLLRLRFHDDLPAQRIAAVLSLPSPFHVYRRLKAVCSDLRRRLVERGIEDSAP